MHKIRIIASALALLTLSNHAIANDIEFDQYQEGDHLKADIPVVITPNRMELSLKDSPSTTSIITKEMIERHGITTITEAMRLVPGVHIDYKHHVNVYASVNYHGTNSISSKRLNILIDGQPVYRPALANILWDNLPVSITEIRQIEFIRSPLSSVYGANSFQGVVNIITDRIDESTSSLTLQADSDDSGLANATLVIDQGAKTTFKVSGEKRYEDGPDFMSGSDDPFDSDNRYGKATIRSHTNFSEHDDHSLTMSWTRSSSFREIDFLESGQISDPYWEYDDDYIFIDWQRSFNNHTFKVLSSYMSSDAEQEWRSCQATVFLLEETNNLYRANPELVSALINNEVPVPQNATEQALLLSLMAKMQELGASAMEPTCGDVDNNYTEERTSIEFVDTYTSPDYKYRSVLTAGFQHDHGDSATYLNGDHDNKTYSLSYNAAWMPSEPFTINFGGYLEKPESIDTLFAPRLSVHYHFNQNNTIRIASTKSFRTPDIWEQNVDWTYRMSNVDPNLTGSNTVVFYPTAISPGDLDAEEIISNEIGYISTINEFGRVNMRVFRDRMYNLLSSKLDIFNFDPSNNGEVTLKGAEIDIHYEPTSRLLVNFGLAYLDNDTDFSLERAQYSRLSGFLVASKKLTPEFTIGGGYYGASNNNNTSAYDRFDFNVIYKPQRIKGLTTKLIVNYRPSPVYESVIIPNASEETDIRPEVRTDVQTLKLEDEDKVNLTFGINYQFN